MKSARLLAIVGAALTAFGAGPVAAANAQAGDSVTADARTADGDFFGDIQIDVRSGPNGENPVGTASFRIVGNEGPHFAGTVTCLAVRGNTATLVVAVGDPLEHVGIQVVDNAGSGTPDTFDAVPFGDPNDCSAIAPGTFLSSVVSGDIAVIDAPGGSPTGTAQCRNGGWRNFSQFQNQLQCILFVARKCGERGRFEARPPLCPARLPG